MKIQLWGRGGEIVVGSITTEQYVYWSLRNDEDDSEFSSMIWGDELEDEHSEELLLGSWYEIDNIAHENGPAVDSTMVKVMRDDETTTLYEKDLFLIAEESEEDDFFMEGKEEYFSHTDHKYGFWAFDYQKGLFGEYDVPGDTFDPKLLRVHTVDIEGNYLVVGIQYDGNELEENGSLSTDGKSFDWGIITNEEESFEDD